MSKAILIADDNPVVLKQVQHIIETQPDLSICGIAKNGKEAIQKALELNPDLIILDLSMPVMNGLEAANAIRENLPSVPILLFTVHKTRFLEAEALAHGIRAVVGKSDGAEKLLDRTRTFLYCDPEAPASA